MVGVIGRVGQMMGRVGASTAMGGGGASGLPTFTYQAETEAVASAMSAAGSPINARRKYNLDRMVRRLDACGAWDKLIGLYVMGDTEAQWAINLKSPGAYTLMKIGTPEFVPNVGIKALASPDAWDTGIPLSALSQNDMHMSIYALNGVNSGSSDAGAVRAGTLDGLSLCARSGGDVTGRAGGTVVSGLTGIADGQGFLAVNRTAPGSVRFFKHSAPRGTDLSSTSVNLSGSALSIYLGRLNGSTSVSGRDIGFATIGAGMTESQMAEVYGAVRTFYEAQRYGDIEQYEAGYAPASVSVDAVVYGATSAGLLAAYELKRQGKSVVVVGGWRDTPANIGGMSAGGLAFVDFHAPSSLGGLPRDVIRDASTAGGLSDASIIYTSRDYRRALQKRLDPSKATGQAVPIYFSTGVVSVAKSGARLTSITTADGRTFIAKYFRDESYESDLMALAGVTFVTGREAAGAGAEASNGFRGLAVVSGESEHQYKNAANALINVDPYVTPGVSGSGLLPNVFALPATAVGAADNETQSFNFRLAVTTNLSMGVPMSSAPPPGYSVARYEALLRNLAAAPTLGLGAIFNLDLIRTTGVVDVNSNGGMASDLWGRASDYVAAATYAEREVIWQDHINWIVGLWYVLQYDPDPRVPAGLRTTARSYYWAGDHFYDRNPADPMHFSPQLYVREMRRLRGSLIWDGNDIKATDGTTPRSVKTIGLASYPMDSHHVRAYADPNGGTPRIWNEGNFFVSGSNGANNISPLPYEITLPAKAECENLSVGFGVSITHVGFGSYRMEETTKLVAQSSAMAIAIALENGDQALQDVDYTAMRARILAAPDTQPQVLPQVN